MEGSRRRRDGVWLLLVAVMMVAAGETEEQLGRISTQPCLRNRLPKLLLNQTGYVEYSEYVAEVPPLTAFTMHYWFNLLSTVRTATTFNYGLNELSTNNNLTVQLVQGNPQHWTLQINDHLVSRVVSPLVRVGEWHHMLHSWDSSTGQWSVFMDGKILSFGLNPMSVGMVVPGGGVPVSGQRQNTALAAGMDQGEGLEGWFTLFQLSARPLLNPNSPNTAFAVTSLASGCSIDLGGDVISWRGTPRRGYGGVMETPGREICGHF
ncbi:C-reactive protein 1.4-like isoform X2 [Homarus americanus]|nr:C-reactive protein 1.4-like isoform X2 [Homarus americanus]XP_042230194.1 C-reactive protein 1.4-like isoform X2 [Homarus americanus]